MKKHYRWIAAGMLSLIVGIGAAETATGVAQASEAAAAASAAVPTSTPYSLYPSTRVYDTRKPGDQLLIKNGVTYMSLKELSLIYSDYVWSADSRGVLTVTGPNHKLTWGAGTKAAYTNVGKLAMAAVPTKKDGQWFYPLKSLAAWAGGEIKLNSNKELVVDYRPLSMLAGDPKGWYWVRRDNGIVYAAIGSELPRTIGWSNVRAFQYYGMKATKMGDSGAVLLTVNHTYGEPMLHDEVYKLVIQNGKLARQSKASYFGTHSSQSIEKTEDGYYLLLSGTSAIFLNAEGNVYYGIDLEPFLGTETTCTVEYASLKDGIALVRPYASGTLMLVDLKEEKAVTLYKELLSKEEQEMLETWPTSEVDYPTDKISLVKREGNVFTFEHRAFLTSQTSTLTYTWERS